MKEFIGAFFTCLVFCYAFTFFFASLILDNFWAIITIIAFVLSVSITVFMKQESRLEELEKKVETLVNDNAND